MFVASVSPAALLFFSGAPAELAVDCVSVDELPSAWNVTAPPAVRLRLRVDSTSWSARTSASERPIPAVPPFVDP